MTGAAGLAPGDHLWRATEMEELDIWAVAPQLIAVLAFQRRTTHHTAGVAALRQPLPDRFQPRIPVVVVQRFPGRHLRDVRRRVKVIGVGERHAKALRQRGADSRFTRTGDAHCHYW